jgi:hypothetical protein
VVVVTHALYSVPVFTVTLGNVAIYSKIPPLEAGVGVKTKEVGLEETGLNASVSRILLLMLLHYLRKQVQLHHLSPKMSG